MASREFLIVGNGGEINFAPSNVVEEVVQNVRMILSTSAWSVPLDRLFGVNAEMLDKSTPEAMAALTSEIYMALRRWEPRCRLKNISFKGDLDGCLVPEVRIEIDAGD